MAQKNFFGIVTIIACLLGFLQTDAILVACLGKNGLMPIILANIFGVIAAAALIYGLFNRHNRTIVNTTSGWAILSCIAAAYFGWTMLASLIGGIIISAIVFFAFVVAIIRYEDLEGKR